MKTFPISYLPSFDLGHPDGATCDRQWVWWATSAEPGEANWVVFVEKTPSRERWSVVIRALDDEPEHGACTSMWMADFVFEDGIADLVTPSHVAAIANEMHQAGDYFGDGCVAEWDDDPPLVDEGLWRTPKQVLDPFTGDVCWIAERSEPWTWYMARCGIRFVKGRGR